MNGMPLFNRLIPTQSIQDPTFMYATPIQDNEIFFEETSLVARPAVSFQECKDRCRKRLDYLGIDVKEVLEEEFCYIPMGGPFPANFQWIVAFGGRGVLPWLIRVRDIRWRGR